jgi:hypothetical protein
VPVTTYKKLHRHLRQYRAFSTAEPVPRLESTPCMAQQCQPGASATGQSAAGEGAAVDMAKSGPTVMAATGRRKQRSSRLQAHVPSWDSERTLSHGMKTTRPCSVPRTARACTTAAPPTTRPVALTIRYHFLRDHQQKGDIEIAYINTKDQLADIFTKPLDEQTFNKLRHELNILDSRNFF